MSKWISLGVLVDILSIMWWVKVDVIRNLINLEGDAGNVLYVIPIGAFILGIVFIVLGIIEGRNES